MRALVIVLALLVCGALARPDPDQPARCMDPDDEPGPELEFDCQKRREFPEEEYEKALHDNEGIKKVVDSYEKLDEASAECSEEPKMVEESADQLIAQKPGWYGLCPTWEKIIWHWAINIRPYGTCYLITPVRVTKCRTRRCRYVTPWHRFGCVTEYRYVNLLLYCPKKRPIPFHWIRRRLPQGCCCQRLFCGWPTHDEKDALGERGN